jgi:cytochrome c heme-lyase
MPHAPLLLMLLVLGRCCRQAFEVVTRPALDSVEAALDRLKFNIYGQFAAWGLPCPVTGTAGRFAQQQQEQQQRMGPPQAAGVAS